MYSKILVPLDGSKTAEQALSLVRSLSVVPNLSLVLLGVVDVSPMTARIASLKARYLDRLIAAERQSFGEYLAKIATGLPNLKVDCVVEHGKVADVIVARAAADKDTLIAMATHGWSGLNRWLLGSVAEKVLRATSNPVLLVRAAESASAGRVPQLKSILVPLDGSALAETALPAAVTFAKVLDLEVVLFRVYDLPASAYYGREDYLPDYDSLKKDVQDEARKYLDAQVGALKAQGLTRVRALCAEGQAAEEILHCAGAQTDSLVAMCTHGRSGMKRWMLGSVTEKVIRHSKTPMLVVRGV